MASEIEIDQLATELLGKEDADQFVRDAACKATEARQWDEVIKWNRVRWRMRMIARRTALRPPPLSVTAAP